jgi:hypothetical protein
MRRACDVCVTCVAGAWRVCGVFECYGRVACAWRCAWPYAVWGLVRVVRVVVSVSCVWGGVVRRGMGAGI